METFFENKKFFSLFGRPEEREFDVRVKYSSRMIFCCEGKKRIPQRNVGEREKEGAIFRGREIPRTFGPEKHTKKRKLMYF